MAGEGVVEGDKVKGEEEGPASPSMTPEQVEEFFQRTIARLTSPEEREVIKSKVCMLCKQNIRQYTQKS